MPEERARVASVFVNRLKRGMRLQTDPSVIYGITKGEGALGRGLRASELATATPYNTYMSAGLPPTPIANPGQAAIEAAANPEPGDDLYFVADGTGGHAFARTLEEHNAERRRLAADRGADGRARRGGGAGGRGGAPPARGDSAAPAAKPRDRRGHARRGRRADAAGGRHNLRFSR